MTGSPLVAPRGRPDPRRRELARYPFSVELQTRWGDMDSMHHLNNAALARYYEEGRIRFIRSLAGDAFRALVGAVHLDYLREAHYPQSLVAAAGIAEVGGSSVRILQALFQDGACIGVADVTLVHVDRESGRVTTVPDDWRARFEQACVRHGRGDA